MIVADFNGDGFPDVATSSPGYSGTVAVLLNNGDGTFGAPSSTSLPWTIYQIAAADLRGNGTVDLVVGVYFGIAVLLGNGDGTFAAPVQYEADVNYPVALAIGTFDANDTPDIVIASGLTLDLFPGNGDGTFGSPLESASNIMQALAVGDFNGDSKLDLVGTNGNTGTISFSPGLGNGSFGPPSSSIAGGQLGGIAAGYLDGDANMDVAVTSGAYVSVLLGNGNGTFQAALQYPAGPQPRSIVLADFNQDGTQDAAVVDVNTESASILLGNGDGSLGLPTSYLLSSQAFGLAAGDLDGNGLPDVVSTNASDAIIVLLNAGGASLLAVPVSNLPNGPSAYNAAPSIALGDWNRDGRQDLAWPFNTSIEVIQSVGGGRFEQTQALSMGASNQTPIAVGAADFNGDGVSDLAASDYSEIVVFPGLADGTFGPAGTVFFADNIGDLATADFTGDGKSDIVFGQYCCGGQVLVVLAGNGDGTFQSPVQTPVGINIDSLLPVDLNGDGRADLVSTSESSVWVALANADGTFGSPTILTTSPSCCYVFWVAVGAFSGGAPDILVSENSASVALFPGNGDGTFGAPVQIALSSGSGPITTGDFDGDGHEDFAVVSGNQNVIVFPGLGNRHFQTPIVYPAAAPGALVSADFAGGGSPDVAMIGPYSTATLVNAKLGATVPSVSVLVGSPASLSAATSGFGPVSYQWRKNGTPLTDGGSVSGATTATLTIDPVDFPDAGSYDVLVTDSCTTGASNAATLAVEFADVPPSNIFHADILTIATAGVTAGCGGADYCPTAIVTRAQMAVFLLKSEHGSAYVPPACVGLFADVPCPSTYANWVEQLANEGVTAGCGNGDYCPDDAVTRAQMAVFLLKTSQGSGYVPPAATAIFGDVPIDGFAAAFIDDLYTRGIAGGCSTSPLLYCPNNVVNRAQMAAFLVNTFF